MNIAIIIFDDFTDLDLFLLWDLFGRKEIGWSVRILGDKEKHVSSNGLTIETHGKLEETINADVVIVGSGKGARKVINDHHFLSRLQLDNKNQLIGSMCAGALILAKLGLLNGMEATTYKTTRPELISMGVNVVEKPFTAKNNVATAGGCLSAIYLAGWIVEKIYGFEKRREILNKILPASEEDIYQQMITKNVSPYIEKINYKVAESEKFFNSFE